jgi:hypothetical protein
MHIRMIHAQAMHGTKAQQLSEISLAMVQPPCAALSCHDCLGNWSELWLLDGRICGHQRASKAPPGMSLPFELLF